MKHFFLLIAGGFIFTGSGLSQAFLPSSVQAHREQLPMIVQHHLNTLDDHVKSLSGKSPLKSAGDLVRLDSTLSYHVFDVGGGNTVLTPSAREHYLFIPPSTEVVTGYTFQDANWHPQERVYLTYDHLGRLIVSFAESYNAEFGIWDPDSRFRVYRHEDSFTEMDSLLVEGWSEELNQWERLLTVKNTFNQEDVLIESLSDIVLGDIFLTFRDVYHYDNDSRNDLIETFLVLEGAEIPAGIEELEYNLGLLSRSTSSVYDEFGTPIPTDRVDYTYVFNAWFLESVRTFVWDEDDWLETDLTLYSYDMYGRTKTIETRTYPLVGEPNRHLESYEYNDNHDITEVRYHDYDHVLQAFVNYYVTFYFYSDITSSVRPGPVLQNLEMGPNPTRATVDIRLESGASIEVLNGLGQTVMRIQGVAGTNTIDLSGMPAGIYPVRVYSADSIYIGQVVRQ